MRGVAVWRPGFLAGALPALFAACGPAPQPRADAPSAAAPGVLRPERPDPCLPKPGRAQAEPLVRSYTGLARAARCQPEVLTIMADVSAALGVGCDYCHAPHDYRVATSLKDIANWMAVELAPRLTAKTSRAAVGCADCHARDGKPRAKILGTPRTETHAIEWMTTELVENFSTRDGKPLRCKTCHGANLGSPEFRRKLLLTDALAALPVQGGAP